MKLSEAIERVDAEQTAKKNELLARRNVAISLRKAIERNIDCALNFISSDDRLAKYETPQGGQVTLHANDDGSVAIVGPGAREEVRDLNAGVIALARAIRAVG